MKLHDQRPWYQEGPRSNEADHRQVRANNMYLTADRSGRDGWVKSEEAAQYVVRSGTHLFTQQPLDFRPERLLLLPLGLGEVGQRRRVMDAG